MSKSFLYLAGPYSCTTPQGPADPGEASVRHQHFLAHCRAAAYLMKLGNVVFSPIAHSHPISEVLDRRHNTLAFWLAQDLPILALADRLIVLTLPGWERSVGTAEEIAFAEAHGIPVFYMEPISFEDLEDQEPAELVVERIGL